MIIKVTRYLPGVVLNDELWLLCNEVVEGKLPNDCAAPRTLEAGVAPDCVWNDCAGAIALGRPLRIDRTYI